MSALPKRNFFTAKYEFAVRQESLYVDQVTEPFKDILGENELGAARIACRHSFRAGQCAEFEDATEIDILRIFADGKRSEEVLSILVRCKAVAECAVNSYKHGAQIHG